MKNSKDFPRPIVQKCTGQKSNRAKVQGVQCPSRRFFEVSGEENTRCNRANVLKNPAITGFLTKKNCTAALTHIVSKLQCSYVYLLLNGVRDNVPILCALSPGCKGSTIIGSGKRAYSCNACSWLPAFRRKRVRQPWHYSGRTRHGICRSCTY